MMSVFGVSPIVGGEAVKGPLAKMILSIEGEPPSAESVFRLYKGLFSAFVVEKGDSFESETPIFEANTVMKNNNHRHQLAKDVLDFASRI